MGVDGEIDNDKENIGLMDCSVLSKLTDLLTGIIDGCNALYEKLDEEKE